MTENRFRHLDMEDNVSPTPAYTIVGEQHLDSEQRAVWFAVTEGQPLKLVRDPGNKYDPKGAIKVMVESGTNIAGMTLDHDVQVGWVARKENRALAEWMDKGGKCRFAYAKGGKVAALAPK
jgi:hypothetical protein